MCFLVNIEVILYIAILLQFLTANEIISFKPIANKSTNNPTAVLMSLKNLLWQANTFEILMMVLVVTVFLGISFYPMTFLFLPHPKKPSALYHPHLGWSLLIVLGKEYNTMQRNGIFPCF